MRVRQPSRIIITALLLLAITGCSGSGSRGDQGGATPPGVQQVSGRVSLPPGSAISPSSLQIWTAWDEAQIRQDGSFTLLASTAGAQLFSVNDPQDRVVLLGHHGFGGQLELNVETTAVSMLMLLVPPAYRATPEAMGAAYRLIVQQPFFPALRDAVAEQIRRSGALDPSASPLREALENVAGPFWQLVTSDRYPSAPGGQGTGGVGAQQVIPQQSQNGLLVEDEESDEDNDPSTHMLTVYNYSPASGYFWYQPRYEGRFGEPRPLGLALPNGGVDLLTLLRPLAGQPLFPPNVQEGLVRLPSPPPPGYGLFASMLGALPPDEETRRLLQNHPEHLEYYLGGVVLDIFVGYVLNLILQLIGPGTELIFYRGQFTDLEQCTVRQIYNLIPQSARDALSRAATFGGSIPAGDLFRILLDVAVAITGTLAKSVTDCLIDVLVAPVYKKAVEKGLAKLGKKLLAELVTKFADVPAVVVNAGWLQATYVTRRMLVHWAVLPERRPVRWIAPGIFYALAVKEVGNRRIVLAGGSTNNQPFVWSKDLGVLALSPQQGSVRGVCISDDGDLAAVGELRNGAQAFQWIRWKNRKTSFQTLPSGGATSGNVAYACAWAGTTLHVVGRTAPEFPFATHWINGEIAVRTRWESRCPNGMIFLDIAETGLRYVGAVGVWHPEPQGSNDPNSCRELRRHLFVRDGGGTRIVVEDTGGRQVYPHWARISRDGSRIVGRYMSGQGFLLSSPFSSQLPLPGTPLDVNGGYVAGQLGNRAYRWQGGAELLDDLFQGQMGGEGRSLIGAYGVSEDGRFMAGVGSISGQQWAFLADTRLAR